MKTIYFETEIEASPKRIWQVLWTDSTYREWTKPFSPGSYVRSDWKQGSRVHFLNGEGGGMYSDIETMIPEKEMCFRHLGEIKDSQEQELNDSNREWFGGRERYALEPRGAATLLSVSVDVPESFEQFMKETFPIALSEVKRLSEANNAE